MHGYSNNAWKWSFHVDTCVCVCPFPGMLLKSEISITSPYIRTNTPFNRISTKERPLQKRRGRERAQFFISKAMRGTNENAKSKGQSSAYCLAVKIIRLQRRSIANLYQEESAQQRQARVQRRKDLSSQCIWQLTRVNIWLLRWLKK